MFKKYLFSLVLLICLSTLVYGKGELWLKILDSDSNFISTNIRVYEKYRNGYIYFDEGYSSSSPIENQSNVVVDMIGSDDTPNTTWSPMSYETSYLISFLGKYCMLDIVENQPGGPDLVLRYQDGVFEVEITHGVINLAGQGDWNPKLVAVKNSFNDGDIYVDDLLRQNIGTGITENYGTPTFPHYLKAIDEQFSGGFVQRYQDWSVPGGNEYTIEISINAAAATYTANFLQQYNITFGNSFIGGGNNGVINVNGQPVNSPTAVFHVNQTKTITATALSQEISSIQYTFTQWGDGVTSSQRTIIADGSNPNLSFTANFTGRPVNTYRNLTFPGNYGEPINLDWDEHPNTNVTLYKIYRKVKHNGIVGEEVLLGTRNRGNTYFTDNDYNRSGVYIDLCMYDVRAYYSTEGTYSDTDFEAVFGEGGLIPKASDTTNAAAEVLNVYELLNNPNPFNPSTNITFSIPVKQSVKLVIFNVLGEKIKELVNKQLNAGSYTVQWNGTNSKGNKVNSGIYFSVLETTNKRLARKMLLSK